MRCACIVLLCSAAARALTVGGQVSLPTTAPAAAFESVATPNTWPSMFLFSSSILAKEVVAAVPIQEGVAIKERAGAPPILPLKLVWNCVSSEPDAGILLLHSEGVQGLLSGVERKFAVSDDGNGGSLVSIETSFTRGDAPLALLLEPLLRLDIALSTLVLAPGALTGSSRKTQVVWGGLFGIYLLQNVAWMSMFGILKM